MAHTELGKDSVARFAEACSEYGIVAKEPKLEGRSMVLFLSAKPSK